MGGGVGPIDMGGGVGPCSQFGGGTGPVSLEGGAAWISQFGGRGWTNLSWRVCQGMNCVSTCTSRFSNNLLILKSPQKGERAQPTCPSSTQISAVDAEYMTTSNIYSKAPTPDHGAN